HEPTTVRFIHEQISAKREVGYTTILKQMQRMVENKGFVAQHKTGKSHTYTALIRDKQVKKSLFNRLVDTAFKGSKSELLLHALGEDSTSEAELEALEQWLSSQKAQRSSQPKDEDV
ncbi:MAG: BlaI/MecI/CopY family transcriptional regulator, partial [Bacteroidota bacterium]